jgi:hypothetical protein
MVDGENIEKPDHDSKNAQRAAIPLIYVHI